MAERRVLMMLRVIIEEVERSTRTLGVSPEEYLLDLLMKDVDPRHGAKAYIKGALELLEQAKEELVKGDLRQASEKVWGACALAIKAHAMAKRGIKLTSHKDLWVYKDEIVEELGEWVRTAFMQANLMHVNFYENLATKRDVECALKEVEKLVRAIHERLNINDDLVRDERYIPSR